MTTPRTIIVQALRVSGVNGVGQSPQQYDLDDALFALNGMMALWARKRWLSFRLADVAFMLTGAATYTIGLGGNIDTVRPDRIEAAFARLRPAQRYPQDYTMQVIDNREDWNRIRSKSLTSAPAALFYDPAWPLAQITVWPAPLAGLTYEVHLSVKGGVGGTASLDVDLGLPPEYDAALLYNLAARLRPAYQLPPDPSVTALALDALNTIRKANTQLPALRMPRGLPGMRTGDNWMAGLVGGGSDPTYSGPYFRLGLSLLDGTDTLQ